MKDIRRNQYKLYSGNVYICEDSNNHGHGTITVYLGDDYKDGLSVEIWKDLGYYTLDDNHIRKALSLGGLNPDYWLNKNCLRGKL